MAREYGGGTLVKYQRRDGKWIWRARLRWSDPETGERGEHARSFDIECSAPSDADKGKRRRASGRGAAQARTALVEWRAQLIADEEARRAKEAEEANQESARLSVMEYVTQFLDRLEVSGTVEASTIRDYRASGRRIAETGRGASIAGVALEDLTPEMVRAWESVLVAPKPEGHGYSATTAAKTHRLLKEALSQAVNDRVLEFHPMSGVKPPKRPRKEPNALGTVDARELIARLDAMRETYMTIAARLAVFCGLRRSEICGLQWGDIDLDRGTLTIRRAIGIAEGGTYAKDTKTDSKRVIPLPQGLSKALRTWRAERLAECMELGISGQKFASQYVIGDVTGYRNPEILSRNWAVVAQSFGIKGTNGKVPTFHDLRHTYATVAIAQGVDVRAVSSTLGHANPSVTLNVYASADPQAKIAAAASMDAALSPAKPAEIVELGKTGTTE